MPWIIQVLLLSILNCFPAFYFLHYILDPIDEEVLMFIIQTIIILVLNIAILYSKIRHSY
jgi:hypothetical protein